jgi:hypothetical protein
MPSVGFEPKIPMFEGPETIHALDRAATVFGIRYIYEGYIFCDASFGRFIRRGRP